jgi:hypothetical protein
MTQATDPTTLASELESELALFNGTETYTNLAYPWLRAKFLLTDGTKHLAEKAKAFWLMDAIASHQINKKVSGEPFQVWELTVDAKRKAILTCTDGNETILARQEIPYTDFPLEHITLYAAQDDTLGGWVIMLTSEY